jgi:hypothetical protein
MNALTPISAYRSIDASRARAAARYRSERRRHFEALLLQSFAVMRARSRAR